MTVYVAKSQTVRDPWPTYVRQIDPASGQVVGADAPIGNSHLVVGVGTSTSSAPVEPYVVVYSNDGAHLIRLASGGPITVYSDGVIGDDGKAVIDGQGRIFIALGDRIVGIDGSGTKFLDVTRPPAAVQAHLAPGEILLPDFGRSAALLVLPNGHLADFVDNSSTSSLIDLAANSRLDTNYGYVEAAAVGADGLVYSVLVDPSSTTNHFLLAQIDPLRMQLIRTVDLGIPFDRMLLGMNVAPSPSGSVFVYASESPSMSLPSTGALGFLWRFDPINTTLHVLPVANDSGYVATLGADGNLYLYAGTAGSSVGEFDASTSVYKPASISAAAPSGTLVRAVFVF